MNRIRKLATLSRSQSVIEGAGVRLHRAVGIGDEYQFDPFLLLDDIHSADPADYLLGFPWHPHRGIETVTYVLNGTVEHGDSIGNRGAINSGDVQWMTAGNGIIHQEMPKRTPGVFRGLQLWVNLPRTHKMMEPRYRGLAAAEIPACELPDGTLVRVLAGRFGDCEGPARDLVRAPTYFDLTLPPGQTFTHPFPSGHTVFAYVLEGSGAFGDESAVAHRNVALFGDGELFRAESGPEGLRFFLFSGEPLREPIAWRGPIVMNTEEELYTAFQELDEGSFIKSKEQEGADGATHGKGFYRR